MIINGIDITTLDIESLRDMGSVLGDLILQHYDKLEVHLTPTDLYERAIKRDTFKLRQVQAEVNRRFQTELLTVLDSGGYRIQTVEDDTGIDTSLYTGSI